MSPTLEDARPLKRRWMGCLQKVLIGSFVVPIGIAASLLVIVAIRQGGAKTQVMDMKQAIRNAGLPIDPVSLETYREQLANGEKAEPWMKVISQFRRDSGYTDQVAGVPCVDAVARCQPIWVGEPWAEREKVQRFLDDTANLRRELAEVLDSAGPIHTPMTFNGIGTIPPAADVAGNIASLLALENLVAIDRGDIDVSEQSIKKLFALEKTLQGELMVFPLLIRQGVLNVALTELRRTSQLGQWQSDQIDSFLTELGRTLVWNKAYRRAMIGDRVLTLAVFDDGTGSLTDGFSRKFLGLAGPRDQLETLIWYEQFLTLPTDDPMTFLCAAVETNDDMESKLGSANIWRRFETMTTGLMMPSLQAIAVAVIRTEENIRLARLALVCQRFEIDRGRWPSSHEEAIQFAQEELKLSRDSVASVGSSTFGIKTDGARLVLWGPRIEGAQAKLPSQPPESYWPEAWRELPPRQRNDFDLPGERDDLAEDDLSDSTSDIEVDMFEMMEMYDADDSLTVPDELRDSNVDLLNRHLRLLFHRDQPSDSYYKWVLQPSK